MLLHVCARGGGGDTGGAGVGGSKEYGRSWAHPGEGRILESEALSAAMDQVMTGWSGSVALWLREESIVQLGISKPLDQSQPLWATTEEPNGRNYVIKIMDKWASHQWGGHKESCEHVTGKRGTGDWFQKTGHPLLSQSRSECDWNVHAFMQAWRKHLPTKANGARPWGYAFRNVWNDRQVRSHLKGYSLGTADKIHFYWEGRTIYLVFLKVYSAYDLGSVRTPHST